LSSADELAVEILPSMISPLRLLAKNRFDSVHKLGQVKCPVLITHGDPDPIISTAQAKHLFAAANEPRTLKIFPGAGHNVYGTQGNGYLNLIVDFVRLSLKTKPANRQSGSFIKQRSP
jgi:pimeloyl-ACP methyl ester carboxylesterase